MGQKARQKKIERERLGAIQRAKTPEGLNDVRTTYAKTWDARASAQFEREGQYLWMASQVHGYKRVLEIGTGNGNGTLQLLRADHVVVSVDENPACLELAQNRLKEASQRSELVLRGRVSSFDEGYSIDYAPITSSTPSEGALLLEGDTLNDKSLSSWLTGWTSLTRPRLVPFSSRARGK